MSSTRGGLYAKLKCQAVAMESHVRELREHLHGREIQVKTLKKHLALLTSDFKYNLKLLEDRDFDLDQCEAQLVESEKLRSLKLKEMDLLILEIANLRGTTGHDAARIQELETTLNQYKESVRSVRERLEEALQLRDQELTCHRSELESLQSKLQQQVDTAQVQEKSSSDAMKACERAWSQRYSECHKTVMVLVAEQENLLKEKLEKDKEVERKQDQTLELQRKIDELKQVIDDKKKDYANLKDQLETTQGRMRKRLEEFEQEKQELEGVLRKRILEEYDGKIAELLAQLQSIEYAVSLERREAHTRFITMEKQHAKQISALHHTVEDLKRERDALLKKIVKLEKELSSFKETLLQMKGQESRFQERETTLCKEVNNLQISLKQAQTLLEKSEVEKTHEISLLHGFLNEARAKEHELSKKEGELRKHMKVLEKSLVEAKTKVERLSKREMEQASDAASLRESLTDVKTQNEIISKKNAEYVKDITTLKCALADAKRQADMFSRKHSEYVEELAKLQQSLIEARNQNDMMSLKNNEDTKDIVGLKRMISEAKSQDNAMRRKLEEQAKQIVELQESLTAAKAEEEELLKAEAAHAEQICVLRASLIEAQKQASTARRQAKQMNAILEATQADDRQKVRMKENASLVAEVQDAQDSESTMLEYSAPGKIPEDFPTAALAHQTETREDVNWSVTDTQELDQGLTVADHMTGNLIQDITEKGWQNSTPERVWQPQQILQEENEFLKARIDELQAENLKVGQVICDLRQQMETVGLLKRFEGFPVDSSKENVEHDVLDHVAKAPSPLRLQLHTWPSPETMNINHELVKVVPEDPPLEQGILSLAEKEELQMLRSTMKNLHDRKRSFHAKIETMDSPEVSIPLKSECKAECPFRGYEDSGDLSDEQEKAQSGLKHLERSKLFYSDQRDSVHHAGNSFDNYGNCFQEAPSQNHSALTVSAEVLKLNDQIARVRQQLTSLCSTDQTEPLPSPRGSMEKSELKSKKSLFDHSQFTSHQPSRLGTYDEVQKSDKMALKIQKTVRGNNTNSLHELDTSAQGKDYCKPYKAFDSLHAKGIKRTGFSDMQIGKSLQRSEYSTTIATDIGSSHDHPAGFRKETLPRRSSLRNSLGVSVVRPNVRKKLKVRVPSVTSSHSDVLCTNSRKNMSDEEGEVASHSSAADISHDPSPKHLRCKYSSCGHEAKPWPNFRNVRAQSSTGSDEREAIDQSLHTCRQKSKTCVVLPEPSGRWSEDSDESGPARSNMPIRRAPGPQLQGLPRVGTKKPWSKAGSKRGPPEEERGGTRVPTAKDEAQLKRSPGSILKKKGNGASEGRSRAGAKKEKAFPANLRDNIYSHQHDIPQFRVPVSTHSKLPLG